MVKEVEEGTMVEIKKIKSLKTKALVKIKIQKIITLPRIKTQDVEED